MLQSKVYIKPCALYFTESLRTFMDDFVVHNFDLCYDFRINKFCV